MSGEMNYGEIQDAARAKVLEAAQEYVDGQERTEGGIVTGWCLVVESADLDGTHSISWCTGNGLPTGEGGGGLARWRMTGMLQDVLSSIHGWVTAWYVKGEEDDD
jgi:hypothetical protein